MIPLVPPPQPRFDPDPPESHVLHALQSVSRLRGIGLFVLGLLVYFFHGRINLGRYEQLIGLAISAVGAMVSKVSQSIDHDLSDRLLDRDLLLDRPLSPSDPTLLDDGLPAQRSDGPEPIPVSGNHHSGACEHCRQTFDYWLLQCQRTNSAYAYCDSCGTTAILSLTDPRMPQLPNRQAPEEICADLEPYIFHCYCGGQFKRGSSPRCPFCNETISAEWARTYIESNAFGAREGWRWQGNWTGPYAFVIESKLVNNNFRDATGGVS